MPRRLPLSICVKIGGLCENPLGLADILAIAQNLHSVFIDAIPVIPAARRAVAKRFITLIDALFDWRVKLVASAAAEPAGLYSGSGGHVPFEFKRTTGLMEMRSQDYLTLPHESIAPAGPDSKGKSGAWHKRSRIEVRKAAKDKNLKQRFCGRERLLRQQRHSR